MQDDGFMDENAEGPVRVPGASNPGLRVGIIGLVVELVGRDRAVEVIGAIPFTVQLTTPSLRGAFQFQVGGDDGVLIGETSLFD